jgi:hypothetical protein
MSQVKVFWVVMPYSVVVSSVIHFFNVLAFLAQPIVLGLTVGGLIISEKLQNG